MWKGMGRHSGNHEKPMGKVQDPGKELEKKGLCLIAATLALNTLSELFQYSVSIKHALSVLKMFLPQNLIQCLTVLKTRGITKCLI